LGSAKKETKLTLDELNAPIVRELKKEGSIRFAGLGIFRKPPYPLILWWDVGLSCPQGQVQAVDRLYAAEQYELALDRHRLHLVGWVYFSLAITTMETGIVIFDDISFALPAQTGYRHRIYTRCGVDGFGRYGWHKVESDFQSDSRNYRIGTGAACGVERRFDAHAIRGKGVSFGAIVTVI
jgi:hypothetical protein